MYTIIRHGEQSSIPSKLFSKVQFSSVCLFNSHKSVCFYLVFNILKMCCILIHFFSFSKSHRLRYLNKHITSRRICFVYSYSGRQLYAPTYFFFLFKYLLGRPHRATPLLTGSTAQISKVDSLYFISSFCR